MTPLNLTLLTGAMILLSTIAGAILGAFLPKWAARAGRVRCVARVSNSVAVGAIGTITKKPGLPLDLDALGAVMDVTYWMDVDIFNEKDTPTGLRDLSVAFRGKGGALIERPVYKKIVHYSAEELKQNNRPPEKITVVNLPPGEWVNLEVMSGFDPDSLTSKRDIIKCCTYADFRGKYPNGRTFRKRIEFPKAEDQYT